LTEQPALIASNCILVPASRTGIAEKNFKQCDPEHPFRAIGRRTCSAILLMQIIQGKLGNSLANGLNVTIVLELFLQLSQLLTTREKRFSAK